MKRKIVVILCLAFLFFSILLYYRGSNGYGDSFIEINSQRTSQDYDYTELVKGKINREDYVSYFSSKLGFVEMKSSFPNKRNLYFLQIEEDWWDPPSRFDVGYYEINEHGTSGVISVFKDGVMYVQDFSW